MTNNANKNLLTLGLIVTMFAFSSPAMAACTINFDEEPNSITSECAPEDMIDYLNDETACAYWEGEYPTGNSKLTKERKENIRREMKKLNCDLLVCNRKKLIGKYANDKELIDAMETALDNYIYGEFKWRDQICKINKELK